MAALAGCGGATSVSDRVRAICTRDAGAPKRELRDLHALDDARVAPLTRALSDALEDVYWLRVAAASGDTELGMSASNLGRRAAARIHAAATSLGAPECG